MANSFVHAKVMERFPSVVNPHDQISDEGEVLFQKCLICHAEVPDIEKVKSIKDVTFRFDAYNNMKDMCYRCHAERLHPGGNISARNPKWEKFGGVPNHWVKPPKPIAERLKEKMKEGTTIIPLDPQTGEITCVSCHNPHERGLIPGKAGMGADNKKRLRSDYEPICLKCHEK